jgi:hypothetical protein
MTVEQFRVRFPLGISVQGATVVMPEGDTLAQVESFRARAALLPLLKGRVRVGGIGLKNTRAFWRDTLSGMTLRALIDELSIGRVAFDPAEGAVRLGRAAITGGDVMLAMGSAATDSLPPATDTAALDLTIDVERFELSDFAFAVDMPAVDSVPAPVAPFDYRHIRATNAGVTVHNMHYGADDIAARFENLRLRENSGLSIENGGGSFAMNAEGISLTDFSLETADSRLEGTVTAGAGITEMDPATPVSMEVSAAFASSDIALIASIPAEFGHILDGKTLTFDGSIDGTLDDLAIEKFATELSPNISLSAHGTLQGASAPERLSGNMTIESELRDLDFAREFIADTALRRRVAIPHDMTLRAAAEFTPEKYDIKEFTLAIDTARLVASGSFAPNSESYAARLRFAEFPLGDFLPRDSLGVVTGSLIARGRGFDPLTMGATAALVVDRFEYGADNFGRVTVGLRASGGDITGNIRSRSDLLFTDIALDARIARDTLSALCPVPMNYNLSARIDSTEVRLTDTIRIATPIDLRATASLQGITAALRSGDLSIDISSPLPPDSLIISATRAGSELQRQLAARNFSPDSLQSAIPGMTLTARAGRENPLHEFVRLQGFDFQTLSANAETSGDRPFRINATAIGVGNGSITLDTLSMLAVRRDDQLAYGLRLANRPTTLTDLGLIYVYGSVWGNAVTTNILQRSLEGAVGFDFGLKTSLIGNIIRAEVAPGPILGYDKWTVREGGNWVEYDMAGRVRADLHLGGMTQMVGFLPGTFSVRQIAVTSDSLPGIPDRALRLTTDGLDLGRMIDIVPTAPDIGGTVSTDIVLGYAETARGNVMAARGTFGVGNFSYAQRRVADIEANVGFVSGGSGRMVLGASVTLDDKEALTARGTYSAGAVDFNLEVPAVPLTLADGFMPPGTARLSGNINGKLHIAGDPARPALTGDVGFTDANIDVAMTGTRLDISPDRITIADNRIAFNDFGLVAPNGQKLSMSGGVNFANLSAPTADLTLRARNFQFVNSTHTGGSQIYGTAALGANITARGTLDAMRVRGSANILGATNIIYIMRDDSQGLRDEKQHIVEFVEFDDSILKDGEEELLPPLRRFGVDVLLGVVIEDGVRATASLDEVNENRVELIGGGDLAFTMNPQGDTRLSGRYTLSGGTLYYKPPVIPQKVFAVTDGSYVEWRGVMMEPDIHVSATQTMNVRLDGQDGTSKDVAFDVTANIVGTLDDMDMRFDLAAPGDIAIQDELLSMDAEGRMQQALTLLIYEQYTGSGYSSKGMALDARSQLNDFVSKEINQWARNNLKGVDFSMGMSTRDDATGGSSTDYSYSVSKTLFSDRVKLSIGGKVSDGADAANETNQILEDVTLEYRLTQRDNMFLKLYRYNTRESILEGEVTETGGGFVMRKKINRIGDIFRRTRPRRDNRESDQ